MASDETGRTAGETKRTVRGRNENEQKPFAVKVVFRVFDIIAHAPHSRVTNAGVLQQELADDAKMRALVNGQKRLALPHPAMTGNFSKFSPWAGSQMTSSTTPISFSWSEKNKK